MSIKVSVDVSGEELIRLLDLAERVSDSLIELTLKKELGKKKKTQK